MSVEEDVSSISLSIRVYNGTTSSGSVKTVGTSFPRLSKTRFDNAKAMAISDVVVYGLSKSYITTEKTVKSELYDD